MREGRSFRLSFFRGASGGLNGVDWWNMAGMKEYARRMRAFS